MLDPPTSFLFRNAGRHGPIMLMYHAVERGDGPITWPWSISLRTFREHLDLLRDHGWTTRTMAALTRTPLDCLPEKTVVLTFDDGYENNLDAVEALSMRGMHASWFIVTGAIGRQPHWPDSGRPAGNVLGPNQLREMHSAGMEIGSHSVNHQRLPTLDEQSLREEVSLSKIQLEQLIGESVDSFAYPYGAWDERCEQAVREAGYLRACTTQTGSSLKDSNPFRLRRLSIFNEDTVTRLARKLALLQNEGAWQDMLHWYKKRIAAKVSIPGRAA